MKKDEFAIPKFTYPAPRLNDPNVLIDVHPEQLTVPGGEYSGMWETISALSKKL